MFKGIDKDNPVIAWFSGGVTSAIACKLCIDWFGKRSVRVVFIDTFNEDLDTYRFKKSCENWYGVKIEELHNGNYISIQEVWRRYKMLNAATGAICSTDLKRKVREDFQKENNYSYQAFGFDVDEVRRAKMMKKNYSKAKPIFPLIYELLTKQDCIKIL